MHHRQRPRATYLGQRAGAVTQPEWHQPSLGERNQLQPHAQRLAVPGGGAGSVRPQARGLDDGDDHARRVGVRGIAIGHRTTPTDTRANSSFRKRQPARRTGRCMRANG